MYIFVNLVGFFVIIIDRFRDLFVELFYFMIDDVMIRYGINLINSSFVYSYFRIGVL